MKTFAWTVPEPRLSKVELESGELRKSRLKDLSRSDLKFLEKWSTERELGPKVFKRKVILRACLGLSVITGAFLLGKIMGLISKETLLWQSAFLVMLITNLASSMPSWKQNETRFNQLLKNIDSSTE